MARGTWGGIGDPNVFKCTVRFRRGVQKCQFGFHLRDVALNDNSEQDVAEEMQTQLHDTFRAMLTTNDAIESWDAQLMGGDTGYSLPETNGIGTDPWNQSVAEPSFIAACISLKSEIRKRYGQGRMFWPVITEGMVDGDTFSAAGVTTLTTLVTAFTTHFTGDPVTHDLLLVNAHRLLPARGIIGQPGYRPEIPASWYDVLSLRLNTITTALRSRKVGVGS